MSWFKREPEPELKSEPKTDSPFEYSEDADTERGVHPHAANFVDLRLLSELSDYDQMLAKEAYKI